MPDQDKVPFTPSTPTLPEGAQPAAAPAAEHPFAISVYLKPRSKPSSLPPGTLHRRDAMRARREVEHAEDIAAVRAFAAAHGLTVEAVEPGRRLVKLSGSKTQMEAAFGIALAAYSHNGRTFHSHAGPLHLPADLIDRVEAVLGLDTRRAVSPRSGRVSEAGTPGALTGHLPNAVGKLYGFPEGADGTGQCIAILEFGGGYLASDNTQAFGAMGLAVPTIVDVSVDGGTNNIADTDSNGEVALDIQVAGGNAPGAKYAVYFAGNTFQGFVNALTQATSDTVNRPKIVSISWGSAEANWADVGTQVMTAMNTALEDAAGLEITVLAASADHLATDDLANGQANVDFPASSPWIIGCGGTQIDTTDTAITDEVVWNDGATGWGTGGGISDYFDVPDFQAATTLPPSVNAGRRGRGVPDVAGDGASASPYLVIVGGQSGGWYGTSAVAPLWAGLAARLNQALGVPVGFFLPALYGATSQPLREITSGDNKPVGSTIGYVAGPGWNACTGLGVPTGALQAFFAAHQAAAPPPPAQPAPAPAGAPP